MVLFAIRILLFVALNLCAAVLALPSGAREADALGKRYVTTFSAPTNYRFSWGIDSNRCSYGSSSGQYITRTVLAGANSITQKEVDACADLCDSTLKCGFFHPILMRRSTEGNVVCALYTTKQAKSIATYSAGTTQSGGSVVASYGFTRSSPVSRLPSSSTASNTKTFAAAGSSSGVRFASASVPAEGGTSSVASTTAVSSSRSSTRRSTTSSVRSTASAVSTTAARASRSTATSSRSMTTSTRPRGTSTSTSRSSTVSRSTARTSSALRSSTTSRAAATASVRMPSAPSGASLIQFQGCSSSSHTIPMLVSRKYPKEGSVSSATTAWVVQHGSSRDSGDYFTSVYSIVGDAGVVIAPTFYAAGDSPAPNSWYQADRNLAWSGNAWSIGNDAVSPAGTSGCSSFDVYDTLIASLRDRSRYPNLQQIIVVAHSAGAAMMGRYSMLSSDAAVKYILANAPVMPYFTSARPHSATTCGAYNSWSYGWSAQLPRYATARTPGGAQAFRNWVAHDITLMTGALDTYSRSTNTDQSCSAQAQGGQNRRDRGYAFWAYINLLAGTGTDVSNYYGYDSLRAQVTSLSPPSFRVRHCVVDGVAHDNNSMFASDCGRAAITGSSTLPAGPGPIRPA